LERLALDECAMARQVAEFTAAAGSAS
jgi:hypothetical protein